MKEKKEMHPKYMFTTHVNIFGVIKKKKQKYHLSNNPLLSVKVHSDFSATCYSIANDQLPLEIKRKCFVRCVNVALYDLLCCITAM